MDKKNKTATDNQWCSCNDGIDRKQDSNKKNCKTATDNEWTNTNKNSK